MDWKDMITGSKAALALVITFIGVIITVAVYSFIGLFIGGSLESAAINSNFFYVNSSNTSEGLTTIGDGMNTTTVNLVSNIELVQTPISFFGTLLLVIFVLAVFGGIVYLYKANKKGKGGDEDMGY